MALRRAIPCLSSRSRLDLRAVKDAAVARSRERVFGPQGVKPGDRYFQKALEGQKLMRWYFPSKYGMQDFGVDEYFEMQAERLAPRASHSAVTALTQTLRDVSRRREELRTFFQGLDEATFLGSPTLQDLYGCFRLVDPDRALPFEVPDAVYREHSPMFGVAPLFLAEPYASPEELQLLVERWSGGESNADALRARIASMQSDAAVRELLLEEKNRLHAIPDFEHIAVEVEGAESAGPRGRFLRAYAAKRARGGPPRAVATAQKEAAEEIERSLQAGPRNVRDYLSRRHRFVDPMFRRRRLKWLERQMAGKNAETEVKFNSYYATHPDKHNEWPTNKGSVTVTWPSPYH